jgi:hypothetical protein
METAKLNPILNKESILKTANARELDQAPQDVLNRYDTYALTHVSLGDTGNQLANLQRVITQNKYCAVGTIVGPYGYGKTSTAVHLWSELRKKSILSVPPFQWNNLQQLLDAVYHWIRFEFSLGPKAYIAQLEQLHKLYQNRQLSELESKYDAETIRQLAEDGRLLLGTRSEDFVAFCRQACELCLQAGYQGLAIFTDELQATIAAYQPSRDQFYADLFQIVKDILGLPGQWTLVLSMDDGTEGIIARDRADMLQRMQRSALYFRVKDVYNRREYPAELWHAFAQRFGFDGSAIMPGETLEAIGQVAARADLGAGPRMVTHALALAVKHYGRTNNTYSPLHFVDDFLAGQMVFDQRGKFITAVKKALENAEVRNAEPYQQVVKLIGAYPMGCSETTLEKLGLLSSFQSFPPLARQELIIRQAGGYIIRYMAEEGIEPEQIEQRLTKDFVSRFAPNKTYAKRASDGFLARILVEPTFNGWQRSDPRQVNISGVYYDLLLFTGTFDPRYPDRTVAISVAAVPQSIKPEWRKADPDADLELRFDLNYRIAPSEPNRLLVHEERPDVAVFQLNLARVERDVALKILPDFLHEYYSPDQLTPFLSLSLIQHLYANAGERPDDRQRVAALSNPLRQFILTLLLNDQLETMPTTYASTMVGPERIKDLFRQMVRILYPDYVTLMSSKKWKENLQQYNYALQAVIAEDGLSIARGRRPWSSTKEHVADAFRIPGRRLTNLESLLDVLDPLIAREDFSGRRPDSEVLLRFNLHQLEQTWLEQVDASTEVHRHNGIEVPAIPAETLMRQAKQQGYTNDEVGEVLRLLQTRKFIDWDQRHNMLMRTVDAIDDLREAVSAQLNQLEAQVNQLANTLSDFDKSNYPLATMRKDLLAATERDQLEDVRNQVRKHSANLSTYISMRVTSLHERLKEEQTRLFNLIREGAPTWLANEMPKGPFHDILEQQRQYLVNQYEETLAQLRDARDHSVNAVREISGVTASTIADLSEILRTLSEEGKKFSRRLETCNDRREDMEKWRKVAEAVVKLTSKAESIAQKYGDPQFRHQLNALWQKLLKQMEAQPLSVMDMHKTAGQEIVKIDNQIKEWRDSRRSDFELRCREYQQTLASTGIDADLTIPYDADNPTDSYTALIRQVSNRVVRQLEALDEKLQRDHQIIRYGIRVQGLSLTAAETLAQQAAEQIIQLKAAMKTVAVDDLNAFNSQILQPLAIIVKQEQELNQIVRRALDKREPQGNEVRLLQLLKESAGRDQVDLRGLVISLLDKGEENLNLDELMRTLQSLFQKNQIGITLSIIGQS